MAHSLTPERLERAVLLQRADRMKLAAMVRAPLQAAAGGKAPRAAIRRVRTQGLELADPCPVQARVAAPQSFTIRSMS